MTGDDDMGSSIGEVKAGRRDTDSCYGFNLRMELLMMYAHGPKSTHTIFDHQV